MLEKCSTTDQQGAPSSELPSTSPASIAAISSRSVIHKPFTQSRIPPDLPMHPAPRHITEEELSVLESCLHRWRTEIENDTRGKKLLIAELLSPQMDMVNVKIEKGGHLWISYVNIKNGIFLSPPPLQSVFYKMSSFGFLFYDLNISFRETNRFSLDYLAD